jgi:hypothetical protein
MLTPVMPGTTVTPLLTVGDRLRSGYRFESIPDGISVRTRGRGRVDLYVNHETSKVPFPYNAAAPTAANGENDFDNSQVSKLILNQHSAGLLNGSFAISSRSRYQRFCSNYLSTSNSGRGRTAAQSLDTPNFRSTNGRVWKMVLDRDDPKKVTSLTVFAEGDDTPSRHRPRSISRTTSSRRAPASS